MLPSIIFCNHAFVLLLSFYDIIQKRKLSDDDNTNEDEDEMLFVRGASPIRKDSQETNSPRRANEHETFDNNSDYEERPNINRHRENDSKRGTGRGGGGGGGTEI